MEEIKEIFTLISAIIGLVGLLKFVLEYRKSNIIQKAAYIDQIMKRISSDQDIQETLYKFQYNLFQYTRDFHGSDLEKKVDKTLQFFSYICYLKEKGIISNDEFMFFNIDISQALRCHDLIEYLYNLYHYECKAGNFKPKGNGIDNYSYGYLIRYGVQNRIIDNEFFVKGTPKYKIYLNI